MTDDAITDPRALLSAIAEGEARAPLAPDVEVLCERALRTRSRVSIRAARIALALEAADARAAKRAPPPRLVVLRRQLDAVLVDLRRAKGARA